MPCECAAPGAVPWVRDVFGDCLYTSLDKVSFGLGLASIACWAVAQLPQVVKNARSGSAEALSPWFLAEWLLGDTCNLLGCLLSGVALPTQTATAAYYIGMDCVLISQAALLSSRKRRRRLAVVAAQDAEDGVGVPVSPRAPLLQAAPHAARSRGALLWLSVLASRVGGVSSVPAAHTGRLLLSSARGGPAELPLCGAGVRSVAEAWVGSWLAWGSALCYLGSRLSQLRKNTQRTEGAQGLSSAMFATAVGANGLYGVSVLLRLSGGAADLRSAAPWLAGSLGVMVLDVVIAAQACAAQRSSRSAQLEDVDADAQAYAPLADGPS